MSYIEIFEVQKDGDVVSYGTTSNNHAFAPVVWDKFMEQYGFQPIGDRFMGDHYFDNLWEGFGTGSPPQRDQVRAAS